MLDKLIKTLDGIWSDEKLELIHRINNVFNRYEYETPGVAIDYLLNQSSTMPNEDLIMRIMSVLQENIDILLLNHTVTMNDVKTQDKLFILENISMIEDFDDQERIYFLATDDVTSNDTRERFLEIIEYVSGVPMYNFEHSVWDVHQSLIDKIAEKAKSVINDYDYDVIQPPSIDRIELFKKYIDKYGRGATMLAIAMGYRLNINYEFILDRFQSNVSMLEPHDPKQAAVEIVGLLIMSDTSLEDIRKKANLTVSQLFTTPVFRTSTLSFVNSVLSEVGING